MRIASEAAWCPEQYRHLLGCETVITSERYERGGDVGYRTAATDAYPTCLGVPERFLSPLTDPRADEFIAQVRSWGPLQPQTITAQLEESLLMVRGGSQ